MWVASGRHDEARCSLDTDVASGPHLFLTLPTSNSVNSSGRHSDGAGGATLETMPSEYPVST
jgi:hypothetical protein